MKVFLAGAAGVIGRVLIPLLRADGVEVVGTTRSPEREPLVRELGATPVIVNALDREGLLAAVTGARPDVIMHLMTDLSGRNFTANARLRIEGTRNLVDAARAAGVSRLIAESISWCSVAGEGPASEHEPLDLDAPSPRRETVKAVQALEQAVLELPEGVVLRYGVLYGAGTWYAHDGRVAELVRRQELPATDAVTSFVHVVDAAGAALAALDWPAGVVNVVDGEPAPGTAWLPVYAAVLDAPSPPQQPGRERGQRGASNAKARREFGWQPIYPTWRDGFRLALD